MDTPRMWAAIDSGCILGRPLLAACLRWSQNAPLQVYLRRRLEGRTLEVSEFIALLSPHLSRFASLSLLGLSVEEAELSIPAPRSHFDSAISHPNIGSLEEIGNSNTGITSHPREPHMAYALTEPILPTYFRLTQLHVKEVFGTEPHFFPRLLRFIEACPSLENLCIEQLRYPQALGGLPLENPPSFINLPSLREVKIIQIEFWAMQYILSCIVIPSSSTLVLASYSKPHQGLLSIFPPFTKSVYNLQNVSCVRDLRIIFGSQRNLTLEGKSSTSLTLVSVNISHDQPEITAFSSLAKVFATSSLESLTLRSIGDPQCIASLATALTSLVSLKNLSFEERTDETVIEILTDTNLCPLLERLRVQFSNIRAAVLIRIVEARTRARKDHKAHTADGVPFQCLEISGCSRVDRPAVLQMRRRLIQVTFNGVDVELDEANDYSSDELDVLSRQY